MTYLVELANKNLNVSTITMLKVTKENMFLIEGYTRNLSRKIRTIKKSQMEILEMKNTTSEFKKSLDGLNRILEIKEESVT